MFLGLHIYRTALLPYQVRKRNKEKYRCQKIIRTDNNLPYFKGDHTLCIWNSTKPGQPVVKLTAHPTEVLACDWSKYDRNVIVTGGVDGRIKAWDLRNTSTPCFELIVITIDIAFIRTKAVTKI